MPWFSTQLSQDRTKDRNRVKRGSRSKLLIDFVWLRVCKLVMLDLTLNLPKQSIMKSVTFLNIKEGENKQKEWSKKICYMNSNQQTICCTWHIARCTKWHARRQWSAITALYHCTSFWSDFASLCSANRFKSINVVWFQSVTAIADVQQVLRCEPGLIEQPMMDDFLHIKLAAY